MPDRELILLGISTLAALLLVIAVGLRVAGWVSAWWVFHSPFGRPPSTEITCRDCKYDLRASPDRCPECGTPPTKMQAVFIRYLMRIDKLDELECRRKARGERYGPAGFRKR